MMYICTSSYAGRYNGKSGKYWPCTVKREIVVGAVFYLGCSLHCFSCFVHYNGRGYGAAFFLCSPIIKTKG